MMMCLLCCCQTEESSSVSLLSVDQNKLQNWALENTGRPLILLHSNLACWDCIHSAKLLANGEDNLQQDWWSTLEDPNGDAEASDETDSEDDSDLETEEDHDDDEPCESGKFEVKILKPVKPFPKPSGSQIVPEIVPCSVLIERLPEWKMIHLNSLKTCTVNLSRLPGQEKEDATESQISFECTLCNKKFKLRTLLKRHLRRLHEDSLLHCKYCPRKDFENREMLDAHCNYYHLDDLQVAQMKLTCNFCQKVETCAVKLKLHMASSHGQANHRFQCLQCKQGFATIFKLKVHSCQQQEELEED